VTSPAVRAAVYTVFAARWIARWMIGAALVFAGLCAVYVAGVCVDYAEPWYDHNVIRQLASAPRRTAPWADLSEQAGAVFPDGTTYRAPVALLHANGFSCHEGEAEAQQTLSCRREPHMPFCAGSYTVEPGFDRDERVSNRRASSYIVCV
jgi:hypothetical protein